MSTPITYGTPCDETQGCTFHNLHCGFPSCVYGEAKAKANRKRVVAGDEVVRPFHEWHEDYGDVLWWKFPVEEPPYVGTPNDLGYQIGHNHSRDPIFVGGWPGYHTHWTTLKVPKDPTQ